MLEVCNFIEKESVAQVFSCEFCKISKNTFFYQTPPVAASPLDIGKNSLFSQLHFFTRDVDQYKNMSLSQLYQLPRTPFSQSTLSLATFVLWILQVFKNSFFTEHPQKQPFADNLQNRCSQKFPKLHTKALVLESLFKKLAGWRPATLF